MLFLLQCRKGLRAGRSRLLSRMSTGGSSGVAPLPMICVPCSDSCTPILMHSALAQPSTFRDRGKSEAQKEGLTGRADVLDPSHLAAACIIGMLTCAGQWLYMSPCHAYVAGLPFYILRKC